MPTYFTKATAGLTRRRKYRKDNGVLVPMNGQGTKATPSNTGTQLVEEFTGTQGSHFVHQDWFYGNVDGQRGKTRNKHWLGGSGALLFDNNQGRMDGYKLDFRTYTWRDDLQFVAVELDVRFDGWLGTGTDTWHGINLWLHKNLKIPEDTGSAINDGDNSGYALDFNNRGGFVEILKKYPDGTINEAYATLVRGADFTPVLGQAYRLRCVSIDEGTQTRLQVWRDGVKVMEAVDDGSVGGPRLTGGRVGLRSDAADVSFDNLTISR